MTSFAARWTSNGLRRAVKPLFQTAATLEEAAGVLDQLGRHLDRRRRRRSHRGLATRPAEGSAPLLFYLHGGGYFAGSPAVSRPLLRAFERRGFDVVAPSYRLAPRHRFPAALDDALAAYLALAAEGRPIHIAGTSAGGGLALSLMLRLRQMGAPLPRSAVLFSPWTDLSVTGPSTRENETSDALFTRRMLKIAARAYLGEESVKNPLASPLQAELSGLPPLLVHAGAQELLRDDSTRLVARARAAGVRAQLRLWPGVPHGWQLAVSYMPEARESLDAAAAFLRAPGQAG